MSSLAQRIAAMAATPTWQWDFTRGALPSGASFTRASGATYFDASGVLQNAGSNVARFDHDPVTGAPLGYLAEMQSTNGIRNNTMVGAVAGTPGTPPTNWSTSGLSSGLSTSIVGIGTSNGINYIDIRVFGTPSASAGAYIFIFEANNVIAASLGQVWTTSAYLALVAGSFTNVGNLAFDNVEYPGGHDNFPVNIIGSVTSTLKRFSTPITIGTSGTTNVQPRLTFSFTSGAAIDFTLRIGLPQIEQQPSATSVIQTSGAAATRAQDVLTMPLKSLPGWNPSQGGVLVATYRLYTKHDADFPNVLNLSDGTSANAITLDIRASGNLGFRMLSGNATQIAIDNGVEPTLLTRDKAAIGWSTTRGAFARNGSTPSTVSGTYTFPVAPTTFAMARNGTTSLGGCLESIAYYAGQRSDAFIQQVSR